MAGWSEGRDGDVIIRCKSHAYYALRLGSSLASWSEGRDGEFDIRSKSHLYWVWVESERVGEWDFEKK